MKTIVFASILWLASFGYDFSHSGFTNKITDTPCVDCATSVGLSASNQNGTSAMLNWGTVPGSGSYQVEVENGSGNANFFKVTTTVSGTSFIVNGLLPTMNYKFKVRAKCSNSKSNWSGWCSFNASNGTSGGTGGGCIIPSGAFTSGITNSTAKLNWNAVGGVSGYRINIENGAGNNNPLNLTINLPSTATSVTVPNLVHGKAYKWKVRSLCGTQTSPWSALVNFTTL